ncbi:hypothetical protein [Rhodopirellula sallentina]|uniref:Putative membrane protein n=1 Tax=Rhodopirellula sallentina SM41 TaxID=1263870 RepID=M5TZZ6_9BACT|nr:hypothetical protein [Rhodopirellula sallentina]EMI54765.1 putative membrane protein [Rhodopirellula sallentina SM41]
MFAGGLIIAATLMFFSVWLFRTEQIGWPNDSFDDPVDEIYLRRRTRSRRRVNALFFLCGLLILVATLATPERRVWWIACWMSAMLVLCTIVALAGIDVVRTMLHHRRRLEQMRKR